MITTLRILIVDDSDTTRRILNTIVRSRHWSVCGEAESGWSGIKKFQELKPDVVLLDLAMPDINGIEVARMMSGLDGTCRSSCSRCSIWRGWSGPRTTRESVPS